ncbi:TetR/AcrR family transcriptional regulator [Nocardia sp. NPDC020380]|uniref:TetR/AcrR family transcriptional regulator n=1 Tax=Nocardia sp. NPDC020380 TaxID=3364309 RepID=UPI0037935054
MSTPRKTPRQQRSEYTFDAILDAAARLFHQYGYAATTTNKVAELAGVSIGTLYHYIPNKDALPYALAERHLLDGAADLLAEAAQLRSDQPPLAETVRPLISAVARLHTTQPHMHRLLYDQAPRTVTSTDKLKQFEQLLAGEVAFHLNRLGVGGTDPGLIATLLVQAVEAQIHGVVLEPPNGYPVDDCIETVIGFWTRALAAQAT